MGASPVAALAIPRNVEVHLSPSQAGTIARRARKLLQDGQITHHQFALLETLLWRCRKAGQAVVCASYSSLQRLGHIARETVWAGLARLEELGLVQKVNRRVKIGWVSRQATNTYLVLAPATESAGCYARA
jgi:hypothetical protein